ncbi:hypothetical protein BCR39DRAFT_528610 [Naematelia encephala]|uniref:Ubiquitin-like domain-containing protein n=1 Tax=Naematelia encephala TaxID=71784 RepID=A0A1Y2B6R9_9TREE|nr:hypothetical protein BCR39DRAFT_528610 [Naematelia encephala]
MKMSKDDTRPLLPTHITPNPTSPSIPPTRSRLSTRLSHKAKGKQRASPSASPSPSSTSPSRSTFLQVDIGDDNTNDDDDDEDQVEGSPVDEFIGGGAINGRSGGGKGEKQKQKQRKGRHVTVIFANEGPSTGEGGNLEIWVEDGESVGHVKDQIRALRPSLLPLSLRLIHSGRLLTDGILLLPWLRALEERVRRQATGLGGDVESVLKDAGLSEDPDETDGKTDGEGSRVWLHCIVGGPEKDKSKVVDGAEEDEVAPPRRRGFDVLLDAGLSRAEVQQMRRQFYESRGEEMPEGLDQGDINDEHARALEEQWIEGDLTAETATTSTEGLYTSILHGLLTGFLFPLIPWPFFREPPLPNFFDADAEAAHADIVSTRVAASESVGGEMLPGVVFGKRMQMGILLGTILNFAFGALRFLN